MLDLSIIIVNWNTKDFLLECIRSIVNDISDLAYEIIVVDNASTDGSVEAVKSAFSQVKIIQNNANLGFAKANNIGIKNSHGRYISLVNSDITVFKGCFHSLIEYMDMERKIGMVGPKLLNTDLTTQVSSKKFPSVWNTITRTFFLHRIFPSTAFLSSEDMNYFEHNSKKDVDALAGAFLVVRREAIEQVGLLDEDYFFYSEDVDWCKRFRNAGWRIVFYPQATAVHHDGGSSKVQPLKFFLEQYRAKLKYWKKHHSSITFILIKGILLIQNMIRGVINLVLFLVIPPAKRRERYNNVIRNKEAIKMIWRSTYRVI